MNRLIVLRKWTKSNYSVSIPSAEISLLKYFLYVSQSNEGKISYGLMFSIQISMVILREINLEM